jgi:hypothetical protein
MKIIIDKNHIIIINFLINYKMSDQNYIDIEDDENGGKVRFIYIILLI